MKHTISHKICIVLALVAVVPLVLASITGSTLAYLTDSATSVNGFTFRQLGQERTVRLSYYYQGSNGNFSQITGNGTYQNVQTPFRENELICASSQNAKFVTPPNGFEVSYITYRTGPNGAQTRVNAGDCFTFSASGNNTYVNVYFAPVTYSIAYDFNGYNQSDITFSSTPLQSTYTVYDMIKVPYDDSVVDPHSETEYVFDFIIRVSEYAYNCTTRYALVGGGDDIGTLRCRSDVSTASVTNNTLLGWEDQNGVLHTYANSGTDNSWVTEITLTGNQSGNNVYNSFAGRTSGNLVLTASWANAVPNNNANNLNSPVMTPERRLTHEMTEAQEAQTDAEVVDDTVGAETVEIGGEKEEERQEDGNATE